MFEVIDTEITTTTSSGRESDAGTQQQLSPQLSAAVALHTEPLENESEDVTLDTSEITTTTAVTTDLFSAAAAAASTVAAPALDLSLPPPSVLTESSNSSTCSGTTSTEYKTNAVSPPIHFFYSTTNMSQQNQVEEYPVTRPSRESVLQRLSEALLRRSLQEIDLSQRGLQPSDAKLVKMALLQNANLTVLKLAYNNLGDAGVATLAKGIATHHALNLLDLGFNNMGDEGAKALARGLREAAASLSNGKARGTLQTLYLAGNLIGEEGAMAIADFIRQGSHLQKLYMTGNRIGGDGVKAITEAILEGEMRRTGLSGETLAEDAIMNGDAVKPDPVRFHQSLQLGDSASNYKPFGKTTILPAVPILGNSNFHDIQELFLGGTDMGRIGCHAVAKLLERSRSLRVLSLPNCDIQDDDLAAIAASIKANKETLPLESVQLSFNKITHKGLEALTNALWGSSSLKQLEVDNNEIGDQGAHHIAAIIPGMKALRTLDVGFNSIKVAGLNVLMKTIAESPHLETLSVSGNAIDVNAAKAVAFAMAYNCSLTSLHLIHCSIGNEGQRHISAGIVSNSRTALRKLTGFEMGPIIVTLDFPEALNFWTNEQILNFVSLMWEKTVTGEVDDIQDTDLERDLDPLSFLPNLDNDGNKPHGHSGPLDATVVVEVAKRAFETLVANGADVFSKRHDNPVDPSFGSPLASGTIMVETSSSAAPFYAYGQANVGQPKSFVAPPETQSSERQVMPDAAQKRRIVEWLCANIKHIKELAHKPFDSRELWRLHQHYFTPVVNESGGAGWQGLEGGLAVSSVPDVYHGLHGGSAMTPSGESVEDHFSVPMSDPILPGAAPASVPMLKRKVSYRFLGDATRPNMQAVEAKIENGSRTASVAKIIEQGHTGHSLPPKTKRARRNRTRISFVPRIKAKLDSYLDVCHEKALITMRQLYFVERALLDGEINPLEVRPGPHSHLSGMLATEAEMIVVDMI